jgi:predicted Rossmann fold flavoprotein
VSTNGTSFRENLLFTHRGMSGPAILQISNYWKPDNDVEIDLIPQITREDFMDAAARSRQQPVNFLAQMVPSKLATRLAEGLGQVEIRSLGARKVEALSDQLKNYRVAFASTEGYDRAEVTLGGVSTDGLSSQTMESKKRKGLYFIGEVVDVTGWLGGYNFQWAWSSGHACGSSI